MKIVVKRERDEHESRGTRPYFITEFEKAEARWRRQYRVLFWVGGGLVVGVLAVAYWFLAWLWGSA